MIDYTTQYGRTDCIAIGGSGKVVEHPAEDTDFSSDGREMTLKESKEEHARKKLEFYKEKQREKLKEE